MSHETSTLLSDSRTQLSSEGYAIVPQILGLERRQKLLELIERQQEKSSSVRRTRQVYAIRNLLQVLPKLEDHLWSAEMKRVVREIFGANYFCVKAIYFDKPPFSNWTVAWHQDLTINVHDRVDTPGFSKWSCKAGQHAVHPPLRYLENIRTLRLHLDACDQHNGALRILPKTHREGPSIYGPAFENRSVTTCEVPAGGALLMSPLLMHSSRKSESNRHRRVIHLEFSDMELPGHLEWGERKEIL